MFRSLLIRVGEAQQVSLSEGAAQHLQPGWQTAVRRAHGYGNRGQSCHRRDHLVVVPSGGFQITHQPRRIGPRRIQNGIEVLRIHRVEQRLAKCKLLRIMPCVQADSFDGFKAFSSRFGM